MKLDELDIDDVELDEIGEEDESFNEDTYTKPWLDGQESHSEEDNSEESLDDVNKDDDIVTTLLRGKGVNPNAVKFQTETGEIEEKAFGDLTKEEQLQILTYSDSEDNYGLEEEEVALINELRGNNLTIDAYKEYIKQQAIEEYLASTDSNNIQYEVDSISDDELYIIDLKAKIPELTDADASAELELAKQNSTLYDKKVQGIRNEYKKREEIVIQQEEEDQRLANEAAAKEFEDTIVSAIQENDTIDLGDSKLTLSEDDMNEVASFILDTDVTGVRHIAKALNDPKELVGMVWYALKGKEAFSQISDYYKQKITEVSKFNYNKGFEDAKSGVKPNAAKSVVKKATGRPATNKKVLTIDDLD